MVRGHKDKLTVDSSILEIEATVSDLMSDLRSRVTKLYDSYMDDSSTSILKKVPTYEELIKNPGLCYSVSDGLTKSIDEMLEVQMRITLMSSELAGIQSTPITSKSEYSFVSNFKSTIARYENELKEFKYDVVGMIQNTKSKLKRVESVSFFRE